MAGQQRASRSGRQLQNQVVELARSLGLDARTEVRAARRLWGAVRRIDVVLTDPSTRKKLGIECKYQSGAGSAEEKIPATLNDIATCARINAQVSAGEAQDKRTVSITLINPGKPLGSSMNFDPNTVNKYIEMGMKMG